MAATSSGTARETAQLGELVDQFEGWRILGKWLPVKKLEIVIGPYRFENLRTALEELALSDLEVSELRAFGKISSKKHFYRGAEHIAPAPRTKVEMLVHADCVADVMSLLSSTAEPPDDDHAEIWVFDAAGAVRIPKVRNSGRSS